MSAKSLPIPTVDKLPDGIVNLADHEAIAKEKLDQNAWSYFSGGAADENTLRANLESWSSIQLFPTILKNLIGGHTRTRLFGRELAHPIFLAPVAFQRLAHNDGELAAAYAAAALGAGMILSTQSTVALEDVSNAIASEPNRGPKWFQLYTQSDREFTLDLALRAEAAGFEAIVLTVDAPTIGARDRERRANFQLPPGIGPVNLKHRPQQTTLLDRGDSALFGAIMKGAPTWDDVDWLKSKLKIPLVLKGVVRPDDARRSIEHGADAIIVSNHGGRTLDSMPATSNLLPGVVKAVDGAIPVLVDGGIRRGTDVFKALALGATAVCIGRPIVWGLSSAGAVGVAHVLRLLRDEFEMAMALCGCATIADITSDKLIT